MVSISESSISGCLFLVSSLVFSFKISYTESAETYRPFLPDICACLPSVSNPSVFAVSELNVTDSYPR